MRRLVLFAILVTTACRHVEVAAPLDRVGGLDGITIHLADLVDARSSHNAGKCGFPHTLDSLDGVTCALSDGLRSAGAELSPDPNAPYTLTARMREIRTDCPPPLGRATVDLTFTHGGSTVLSRTVEVTGHGSDCGTIFCEFEDDLAATLRSLALETRAVAIAQLKAPAPVPAAARAQPEEHRLLAVLPLDVRHAKGKMDADAQASVEEMLRDVATNELSSSGWTVLTGETTLQVLRDNGVDPARCGEDDCHLASARELNVSKFVSGAVEYVDGLLTASIRIIDTKSGRILAAQRASGTNTTELRRAFEANATAFFRKAGMVAGEGSTPAQH